MDFNFKFSWNKDEWRFACNWLAELLRKKVPSCVTIRGIVPKCDCVVVSGCFGAWWLLGRHDFEIKFRIATVENEYAIIIKLEDARITRWVKDVETINNVLAKAVPPKPWVSYSRSRRCIRIVPLAQLAQLGIKLPGRFALDFSSGFTVTTVK